MKNRINWLLAFVLFINLYASFSTILPIFLDMIVVLGLLIRNGKISLLNRYQTNLLLISVLIVSLLMVSAIGNMKFSSYSLFRGIRISLLLAMIGLFCNNYMYKISIKTFTNTLFLVMLINVLCVYFQMIYPDCKQTFYSLFFTEKEYKMLPLRAFGLYSSYDATGLCTCGLLLLLFAKFLSYPKFKYFYWFLFVFISVFFISRYSMILGIFILLLFAGAIARYRFKVFITIFFPLFVVITAYLVYYIISILSSLDLAYSYGDSEDMLVEMIVFPDDIWSYIIGTGNTIDTSDIGYVKIVYMMGVSGVLAYLFFYGYSIYWMKGEVFANKDYACLSLYAFSSLILLWLFNFKLLLIYSRGYADLYLIVIIYLYSQRTINHEKN